MTRLRAMTFGRETRRRRAAVGFTIEELAARAGITPHHLSNIETRKVDPRLSTVLAIAKALGKVPPGELLNAGGTEPSGSALEMARLYDGVSPEIQDGIARILRATARRPK